MSRVSVDGSRIILRLNVLSSLFGFGSSTMGPFSTKGFYPARYKRDRVSRSHGQEGYPLSSLMVKGPTQRVFGSQRILGIPERCASSCRANTWLVRGRWRVSTESIFWMELES
jgi:hypothetical protein